MALFGTEDHLECIVPIDVKDAFPGQSTCLGFKFSVKWAGVPWRVSDDGYVLTTPRGKEYIALDAQRIHELQVDGTIATPAPGYEIPIGWRLAPYSAYVLIIFVVAVVGWKFAQRRKLRILRESPLPVTTGVTLARRGDRKIQHAIRPHLEPGEEITHQAVAYEREQDSMRSHGGHMHLAALTNHRLILATSNVGLMGMFRGKQSIHSFRRNDILKIDASDEVLVVHANGAETKLVVPFVLIGYSSTNQRAFLVDLPRIL